MPRLLFLAAYLMLASLTASAAELSLTQEEDGITLNIDGELFTRYLIKSERRPVLWPVIGPTGEPMTRAYPVAESTPRKRKITRTIVRFGSASKGSTASTSGMSRPLVQNPIRLASSDTASLPKSRLTAKRPRSSRATIGSILTARRSVKTNAPGHSARTAISAGSIAAR